MRTVAVLRLVNRGTDWQRPCWIVLLMGVVIVWVIACGALVAAIALFDRWRLARIFKRILNQPLDPQNSDRSARLEPESQFIVRLSDEEVVCERPDGKVERVSWSELQ